MKRDRKPMIFAGSASPKLTDRICRMLSVRPSLCETKRFSDGNSYVRIHDPEGLRGRSVFVVQSLTSNDGLMELLFFMDALKRAGARHVTAVIPCFGYGRGGDKLDEPGVSLRARVVADCLQVAGIDRIITCQLHATQLVGFFGMPVEHLSAMPVMLPVLKREVRPPRVVVAPDAGAVQMACVVGRALSAPVAVAEKTRSRHDERAQVACIIGDVAGRNALIVDDLVTSGGTLLAVAACLKSRRVKHTVAAVTHALCTGDAWKRLEASPIQSMVVGDTMEPQFDLPKIARVVSVAPLLGNTIKDLTASRC